ncbi:probable E3 SUMO-protein ligase RanBP2 at C-terminar half [Coccomyxa sp. Obi]|nr:probable E3 SUMO-protein ligase RanBP2 at C-terminar half [Coccomyxa sp. Obi]
MSNKRPTDHLIPSAKKRSGDRQISREEPPSDSDEEVIAGEFRRADEGTLKQRRIFKARRGGALAAPVTATAAAVPPGAGGTAAEAPAAAPAGANPFAGISLTAPAAGGNPFAGVSLVAPTATPASDAAEKASEENPAERSAGAGSAEATAQPDAAAKGQEEKAEEKADKQVTAPEKTEGEGAAEEQAAKEGETKAPGTSSSSSAFATFASASGKGGFGGLASGAAAAGNGFGGFGGAASGSGFGALGNGSTFGAPGSTGAAPVFGTSEALPPASSSFSFSTGASSASSFTFSTTPAAASSFPPVQNIFGSTPLPATSVFGGAQESRPAVLPLPEESLQRVTGEEEERSVFSGDGVLFEYIDSQWRERGRGEMKVNVGVGDKARLVMRQRGNLRLLLNANIFPLFKLTPMDGGKGVTFACINAAMTGDAAATKKDDESKEGEASVDLSTFAFRVKVPGKLEEFTQAVQAHIPPAEHAALGNENNV